MSMGGNVSSTSYKVGCCQVVFARWLDVYSQKVRCALNVEDMRAPDRNLHVADYLGDVSEEAAEKAAMMAIEMAHWDEGGEL